MVQTVARDRSLERGEMTSRDAVSRKDDARDPPLRSYVEPRETEAKNGETHGLTACATPGGPPGHKVVPPEIALVRSKASIERPRTRAPNGGAHLVAYCQRLKGVVKGLIFTLDSRTSGTVDDFAETVDFLKRVTDGNLALVTTALSQGSKRGLPLSPSNSECFERSHRCHEKRIHPSRDLEER